MKLALYARVSKNCLQCGRSPEQHKGADHEFTGQDPEVQLGELRAWCKKNGHAIAAEYVDRMSGAKTSRPQLDRLMRDAVNGLRDFDAVLVWRLDRFGRSLQHLQNAIAELRGAKLDFISLKEGFDLTTSVGKLMFDILGAFAEFERNIIAERIRAGLKHAKAKGRLPGPKVDPAKGPSRTTIWRRGRGKCA